MQSLRIRAGLLGRTTTVRVQLRAIAHRALDVLICSLFGRVINQRANSQTATHYSVYSLANRGVMQGGARYPYIVVGGPNRKMRAFDVTIAIGGKRLVLAFVQKMCGPDAVGSCCCGALHVMGGD